MRIATANLIVPVWLLCCHAIDARARDELWVLDSIGSEVYIYDIADWQLKQRLQVGEHPHGICTTADHSTVFISLECRSKKTGELIWMEPKSRVILDRLAVGPRPNSIACTGDGKWVYVPCWDGRWWVVDGIKKSVVTHIYTGGLPHNTWIHPDGRTVYLGPLGGQKVTTLVDSASDHQVTGTIRLAGSGRPADISKDGTRFFSHIDGLIGFQVADVRARTLTDTVEHAVPDELRGKRSRCHGLAIHPDQKEIWSCNAEHHLVHVTELSSGNYLETDSISTPGRPYWIIFSPDGRHAFVSLAPNRELLKSTCLAAFWIAMLGLIGLLPLALYVGRSRLSGRSLTHGRTDRAKPYFKGPILTGRRIDQFRLARRLAFGAVLWFASWAVVSIGIYTYRANVEGSIAVIDCSTKNVTRCLCGGKKPTRTCVVRVSNDAGRAKAL